MRKSICILLALACLAAVYPLHVCAVDDNDYFSRNIVVIVDKDGQSFEHTLSAIVNEDEIYVEPQSLSEITRYQISEEEKRIVYSLGLKSLWIDLSQQTLQVNLTSQPFSGTLFVKDTHYLPLSELLPWMNVECYEINNTLHIDSDPRSYWEVTESFSMKSSEYLFDLSEQYGQTAYDTVTLSAISVFDCILDLENVWKRIVPIEDSGTSLYEYEIYKECFREFALSEVGTEAELQEILSNISDIVSDGSQFLSSNFEAIYTQETYDKIVELFGADVAEGLDKIPEDTAQVVDTLKQAKTAIKYLKTSYLYTRIAIGDTIDYAQALRYIYMSDGIDPPAGIELAASEAIIALESQAGAIADAVATMLAEWGISALEDISQETAEGALETVAGKTILTSLGLYLDIIDATLSLFWPVNDAFSDIGKMSVFQSIQYDALNAYYSVPGLGDEVTIQDISNGRTCALIYLKTAKKCYEAQQKTFDLFGGEDVLYYKIQSINKEIVQFELSALAEERDSICDRSDEVSEIKELWRAAGITDDPQQTMYDTSYLGEWVHGGISGRYGVIWDRTLTINSIDGNLINFDIEFYRLWSFENQTATINSDGSITFVAEDEYHSISGSIELDDSVTMYINESTFEGMPSATIDFERRNPRTIALLALTTGVWYQFCPDAGYCEEYTFFADNTYMIKGWEYVISHTDKDEYIYDHSRGFYSDQAPRRGTYNVDAEGNLIIDNRMLTYDQLLDRFEGPSGWIVNGKEMVSYMVHYPSTVDTLQVYLDYAEFYANWRINNDMPPNAVPASMLVIDTLSERHIISHETYGEIFLAYDIPCVALPGEDVKALNREIFEMLSPVVEEARAAKDQDNCPMITGISYNVWSDTSLFSLQIILEDEFGQKQYIVRTVGLDDYSVLSSRDIAARYNITSDYDNVIREVVSEYIWSLEDTGANGTQQMAIDILQWQRIVDNAVFFVGENGRLMLSFNLPYFVGREVSYCIPVDAYLHAC